jgi:hypothetical protein
MTCVEIIVLFVFITDVEEEEETTKTPTRRSGGVGSFF